MCSKKCVHISIWIMLYLHTLLVVGDGNYHWRSIAKTPP